MKDEDDDTTGKFTSMLGLCRKGVYNGREAICGQLGDRSGETEWQQWKVRGENGIARMFVKFTAKATGIVKTYKITSPLSNQKMKMPQKIQQIHNNTATVSAANQRSN